MTPTPAAPMSGYITTGQAAARIGSTSQYVRELVHAGHLAAIDIGTGERSRFRVTVASVEKFLADRVVRPTSPIEVAA
ncbi:excisionase family DNA-binding protein [Streptomyces brevispora]|uniref:excisionase family DNA-binding protein n=1 Tax=Streptomyces brevispora TaxID=887462 RepID=UPI002E35BEF2|nr:excisionase family DNA-binding protein [Streptomyces brevispora]